MTFGDFHDKSSNVLVFPVKLLLTIIGVISSVKHIHSSLLSSTML